jgi:hypothetical protein
MIARLLSSRAGRRRFVGIVWALGLAGTAAAPLGAAWLRNEAALNVDRVSTVVPPSGRWGSFAGMFAADTTVYRVIILELRGSSEACADLDNVGLSRVGLR